MSLFEQVNLVAELSQDMEMLREQLWSSAKGRNDDLLVADAQLFLCQLEFVLFVEVVCKLRHASHDCWRLWNWPDLFGHRHGLILLDSLGWRAFHNFLVVGYLFHWCLRNRGSIVMFNMLDVKNVHLDSRDKVVFSLTWRLFFCAVSKLREVLRNLQWTWLQQVQILNGGHLFDRR